MKISTSILIITGLLSMSVLAEDTNSLQPKFFLFATNSVGFDANTNLMVFGPPYGTNKPANFPEMLKTNGLECWMDIFYTPFELDSNAKPPTFWPLPVCLVSVFNHSISNMACLRMPTTNLCRILLLDKQGHKVQKTTLGMMYGLPLSQEQIDWWFNHWNTTHQSIFIRLTPNGIQKSAGAYTEICRFSIKDAFEIKEAGEYDLHLQLRLVQVGTDSSGKKHYPVTWLPEVAIKVEIRPEDIPPEKLNSTRQP